MNSKIDLIEQVHRVHPSADHSVWVFHWGIGLLLELKSRLLWDAIKVLRWWQDYLCFPSLAARCNSADVQLLFCKTSVKERPSGLECVPLSPLLKPRCCRKSDEYLHLYELLRFLSKGNADPKRILRVFLCHKQNRHSHLLLAIVSIVSIICSKTSKQSSELIIDFQPQSSTVNILWSIIWHIFGMCACQ